MGPDELSCSIPQGRRPSLDCRPVALNYLLLCNAVFLPCPTAHCYVEQERLKSIQCLGETGFGRLASLELKPQIPKALGLFNRE